MYKGFRIGVVIAAAGSGSRMGISEPKQFLKIGGEPMIAKTCKAFADSSMVDCIYIVTAEEDMEKCREIMMPYLNKEQWSKCAGIVAGGAERQESVYMALQAAGCRESEIDFVLIHDCARPYVTRRVIEECVMAAVEKDSAVACVKAKDTIRTWDRTLDRDKLLIVQTPQAFRFDLILRAHEKAEADGFHGTDDVSLVERIGVHPCIVRGEYSNIKITTIEDLPSETRTGKGYDVHRLVEGRPCIIGGVRIPNKTGLKGHSDADVLLHAIMDALLGAVALGDIGRHFPDSDPAYEGADSLKLLEQVGYMIADAGYTISNIDATVICEKPKILPYAEEMIENIARVLKISVDRINIKGTTTERLGFTGRKEGIAAEAVATVTRR